MKSNLILIILLFSTILFSCRNAIQEEITDDSGLIEISKAQFESENMKFGDPVFSSFNELVHFTGKVIPSSKGLVQINLIVPGYINKIQCAPGQYVTEGSILFKIAGNEIIDLQKEFAKSNALLQRLESEYQRAAELNNENIGTRKDFIHAESEYKIEKANYNALKLKLEQIGLNIDKIKTGEFNSSYSIPSPINGYITNIGIKLGQYIESQQILTEIIDPKTYLLQISVFEKDYHKIELGQNITFYFTNNKSQKFDAKINGVGKTIDTETKSVICYAEIETTEDTKLINNLFVEGDIIVNNDTALSIPESAIIDAENETFVLILENETNSHYYFKPLHITTGRKNNNLFELKEFTTKGKILMEGVYNIIIE
jgi:membrane fusion protein, heavy metal efflux system